MPHWQSDGGLWWGTGTAWTPSLSLPLSTLKIRSTVANPEGLIWTEATGAKNFEALVAQLCLVLLLQTVLIIFTYPIKNMDEVSPAVWICEMAHGKGNCSPKVTVNPSVIIGIPVICFTQHNPY